MNYLLYCFYVSFFICLFLSDDFYLANSLFVYFAVPIALLPIEIYFANYGVLKLLPCIRFEPINLRYTLFPIASSVFLFSFSFGAVVVLSSAVQPSWSTAWFLDLSSYLVTIAFFMLITARLALVFENFYENIFLSLSVLATINAIINLNRYFSSMHAISDFVAVRFAPSFGRIPDHFPTTGALTYATILVAASGLLSLQNSVLRKIILSFCVIILLIAIMLTQSRGPLLGSLFAIVVSHWSAERKSKFIALLLPAIAGGIFLLIPKIGLGALERLDNHRLEDWIKFTALARERLLFGYGERLEFHIQISDGEVIGHAHNIFISAFIRGGILAGFSFIAAYLEAIVKTFLFAREFKNPILLGLVSLILVAGLVDFDQLIFLADWQWLSFWMPLGLAVSADQRLSVIKQNLNDNLKYLI